MIAEKELDSPTSIDTYISASLPANLFESLAREAVLIGSINDIYYWPLIACRRFGAMLPDRTGSSRYL